MKKGLLLSVAASAVIFAGGDIQPVEPAAPASSDFWGQIGFAYQAQDDDWGVMNNAIYNYDNSNTAKRTAARNTVNNYVRNLTDAQIEALRKAGVDVTDAESLAKRDNSFGARRNNEFSASVVLGVEKELGYGLGFGAELAGWTDFDLDLADRSRVLADDQTDAEVSQAYLTYKYCNTAIKAGRQALPKAVSPWAWSDRSGGVLDITYEGVVIANTDLPDTTLVGAWIKNAVNQDDKVNISDNGLFMVGLINKSFCDTTITLTGYYVPGSRIAGGLYNADDDNTLRNGTVTGRLAQRKAADGGYEYDPEVDVYSVWATIEKKFGDYTVGVQGAYVDGDAKYLVTDDEGRQSLKDFDATFAVAGKIGADFLCGDLHTELTGWYINDGDYSLKTAGSGVGTSGFWGNRFGGEFNGEAVGSKRTGGSLDFSYKLWGGTLFGGVGYEDWDTDSNLVYATDKQVGGRIGYKTKIMGVDTTVQYRYLDVQANDSAFDHTRQKIRVEAYYKF